MANRLFPCLEHPLQQTFQGFTCLQVAQTGRIGRGNIHGKVIRQMGESGNSRNIVGNKIVAVLVCPDIDPDNAAALTAFFQPDQGCLMTLIVEPQPVDDTFFVDQPEYARFGISLLGARGKGSDFREAETQFQDCVRHLGILVVTGGKAHRIFECEPCKGLAQAGVADRGAGRNETGFQRLDRQPMRRLRVKGKHRLPADGFEQNSGKAHDALPAWGISSGKMCRPLSSSNNSCHSTAQETGKWA